MTRATIIKEEVLDGNRRFLAVYIETKNAVLVLLSEAEDQLGTLAASVPPTTGITVQPFLSSVLLGDRYTGFARMFAERLASKTGKIGLVSVHLTTVGEMQSSPVLTKLFEKVTSSAMHREKGGESVST